MLKRLLLIALCWQTCAALHLHASPTVRRPLRSASPRSVPVCAEAPKPEYTKRQQMLVEAQAPFRQARLFFLYPSCIAGASIGGYVSFTRVLAAVAGFRTDTVPLQDGFNFFVDIGVVVAAVLGGRSDIKGKDADLARLSGRGQEPAVEDSDATED